MTNDARTPDWESLIRSLPKKKSLFKCFKKGTLRSSEDEGVYTCECKDGWHGPNCSEERPKFSSIFRYSVNAKIPRFSDDYTNCEEEPDILEKLKRSLPKVKKCTYIAGPLNPNGLLLGRFNIKWADGEVMPINYLGMGEDHRHDLDKIKKLGGRGGTILPSVFIKAAMASARVDNKCVDLFVEHSRFQPEYYRLLQWNEGDGTNMMSRLANEVAPCLYGIPVDSLNYRYKSRTCKFGCKNVRIHETDIRNKDYIHNLLPYETVFGEGLWDLGWLQSKLEIDSEDILKFMLYEESMDDRQFELVLYRAVAKQIAYQAYYRKHVVLFPDVITDYLQFLSWKEWLRKPMRHVDYLEDFKETKSKFTGPDSIPGWLDLNPSYTNWDRISQVAHRVATDTIYYRNAMKKLIRKREIALGARRSAQLRKAMIKVHNLLTPNTQTLLDIKVLSMDYYTMLRMLSPYDLKKRAGPCPPGILGGDQPRYIMMIGGAEHTKNYAYIFRELAGLPINNVGLLNVIGSNLENPFRITNTLIIDKTTISEAGNSIKTGLDLINEWMEAEIAIPSPPQSPSSPSGGKTCKGRAPKGKICNPKTGRWVKRNGKIGRQILANQSPSPSPSPSPPGSPGYQYKNCRKYRKTKDPKCKDQDGCEWVVGTGCIRSPSR